MADKFPYDMSLQYNCEQYGRFVRGEAVLKGSGQIWPVERLKVNVTYDPPLADVRSDYRRV